MHIPSVTNTTFPLDVNIAFSIFNRPDTTAQVFEAIRKAQPSRLFIIADGPRPDRQGEQERCQATRDIVDSQIDWPCDVFRNYSEVNLGCRLRMATGYDWVFQHVEHCILLEDDCLPHPSFFPYCQELLHRYKDDERVMAISGDNFQNGRKRTPYSYYFSGIVHVWGWATWRRTWRKYDIATKLWPEIKHGGWLSDIWNDPEIAAMWTRNFDASHTGYNSWDHQLSFALQTNHGLCVLPSNNLVSNIGFGPEATHTTTANHQANIPALPMSFPLHHPPFMIRDTVADKATYSLPANPAPVVDPISGYYKSLNQLGILNYQGMQATGEIHFLQSMGATWQNPLILDVGANEGEYTRAVLDVCPSARVIAFEPHPITCRKLRNHLDGTQVSIHNFGLGDKDGTAAFYDYSSQDGSSHASLYKEVIETIHHGQSVCHEVSIRRLDDVIEDLDLEHIHLLKVDVEGHELAVLRGCENAIRKGMIDLIQFEFNETNVISRTFFKDFWDLLSPQYNLFRLLPNGEIHISQYTPSICEVFAFQNIVCVRKA
jgi:FkbM family methyltransferase